MSENKKRGPQRRGPGSGHGPFTMPGDKAVNFKVTIKKLLGVLKPYRFRIATVVIFAILSATFGIVGPKVLGNVTTEIFRGLMGEISGEAPGIDFTYIGNTILILLGLYVSSSLFSYIQGYIMSDVSMGVSYGMREKISKKINQLPLSYYDKTTQGEVLSRVTNDVDTVSRTLNQSITQIITAFTTVTGVLIMMLTISVPLTLVTLLVIPVSFMGVMQIVKRSQKYFKQRQDYLGHVNGHIEEDFAGHQIVKAFNRQEETQKTFNGLNDKLYEASWKSQFLSSIMMPMMTVIGNLSYVVVSVLGGALAVQGKISIGDIQAFIQYVRNFTQPLSQLANSSNILQQTAAAAERVFEFLEEDNEISESATPVKDFEIKGKVEFKNVKFGYNPDQTIIHDFSANVLPGQRVAIVGPTGAGKTTIVKLLMRFYDIQEGTILIDDHEIRDFTRKDLRGQFGMVLQDTWLYNGTIMENIRYGRLDATDEEVIEASKAAHVDSFVHSLPNGYDMILNEEASNISQGQKQLITIARAILADPKLLILDEATSSVDTRTEVQIQKAMETLMEKRTSFIIAHRLSTIKDADLILVMNHGDIVEMGNHVDLLNKNGFYADLYNSQFEN